MFEKIRNLALMNAKQENFTDFMYLSQFDKFGLVSHVLMGGGRKKESWIPGFKHYRFLRNIISDNLVNQLNMAMFILNSPHNTGSGIYMSHNWDLTKVFAIFEWYCR